MNKLTLLLGTLLLSANSWAEEATAAATTGGSFTNSGLFAISAGLAIGIAAFGGAIAQGKIGSAAMEGIARNPQARQDMFVPMIIGLALVESLVIYALVIAFQMAGKI
jgi:F-type H+-transporting ATPase subunit c